MELRIGTIKDYNNKIVVAKLGLGDSTKVNSEVPPPPINKDFEGTKTKPH